MKFPDRLIERSKRDGLHLGVVPEFVMTTLREHHDEGEVRAHITNGAAESVFGRQEAVGAALT